jgi:hypothetical protein
MSKNHNNNLLYIKCNKKENILCLRGKIYAGFKTG